MLFRAIFSKITVISVIGWDLIASPRKAFILSAFSCGLQMGCVVLERLLDLVVVALVLHDSRPGPTYK